MMTINHPDVRAIHSSGRRKPSDTFNNALILSAPCRRVHRRGVPPNTASVAWFIASLARLPDHALTEHRAP